jgi:hypothetical protein
MPSPAAVTQRELLGLILGCAARSSATFGQAEFAILAAGGGPDPRTLTRELLLDLAIRGWIELRVRIAGGSESAVESRNWEFELRAERNWDAQMIDCACYALTDKGESRPHRASGR